MTKIGVEFQDIPIILKQVEIIRKSEDEKSKADPIRTKGKEIKKEKARSEMATGTDQRVEMAENEEEEQRLFQLAVLEYRNQIKKQNNQAIENDLKKETKTTSALKDTWTNMEIKISKKECCWECYKVKSRDDMLISIVNSNKVIRYLFSSFAVPIVEKLFLRKIW